MLERKVKVSDLDWMECEVTKYRQGVVTVHLDFRHNLLTWKDSNRWFNDMVKTFSTLAADRIKERLQALLDHMEIRESFPGDPNADYMWRVTVGSKTNPDLHFECGGFDRFNVYWPDLLYEVEQTSGQLMDPIGGH